MVEVDGSQYAVLAPLEEGSEEDEAIILKIVTDENGKTSEAFSFTESGNLVLEHLNVDRPSTTMQRFIKWLSSWEYAKYIMPIINLLKWFDSL